MTLTLRHSLVLQYQSKAKAMENYGVQALANLSGVSVRTLHHYDKIGLLKPQHRTETGYRVYSEKQLLRLQQILFYKELGFSLTEIKAVLDNPNFDVVEALEQHKIALKNREKRIAQLLQTIDTTIHHLKNETVMKPEDLYKGLSEEFGTTHRKKIADKYGRSTLEKSEKALTALGKTGFQQLKDDFESLNEDLFVIRHLSPQSEKVQAKIAQHYAMIRQFWGTTNEADKQADAYAGLGQLYLYDERYTQMNGKTQPEFAQFLADSMKYFAETQLR